MTTAFWREQSKNSFKSVKSRHPYLEMAPVPMRHHHGSSVVCRWVERVLRTPWICRGGHGGCHQGSLECDLDGVLNQTHPANLTNEPVAHAIHRPGEAHPVSGRALERRRVLVESWGVSGRESSSPGGAT